MDTNRPVPPFSYSDAHYSGMIDSANSNKVVAGKGIRIEHGSGGTIVHNNVAPIFPNAMRFVGTYDYTSGYHINDVVYVDPNIPITDQTGNVIPNYQPSGSLVLPICPGLFVCCRDVPPIGSDYNYLINSVLPAYTSAEQTISDSYADSFRHYQYNIFYPIFPVIPLDRVMWVPEHDWYVQANSTYWTPLMAMITSSLCDESGNSFAIWLSAVLSPAPVFNNSQLPWDP